MEFFGKKFRVVIINQPIEHLDNPQCSSLWGKILKMKKIGYCATYGNYILPMDKTDFFSTHLMLCEEKNNDLIPILAYKSTNYQDCLNFQVEFPALTLMKSDGHPTCVQDIESILKRIPNKNTISFDSSWAQNLEYRFSDNLTLKEILREITMMYAVKHHGEFNIPHMMTCGAVKVKTDKFFEMIGLNPLNNNAHFKQKSLNNEDAVIFYNDKFSKKAHEMSVKYASLWDEKILIGDYFVKERKVA